MLANITELHHGSGRTSVPGKKRASTGCSGAPITQRLIAPYDNRQQIHDTFRCDNLCAVCVAPDLLSFVFVGFLKFERRTATEWRRAPRCPGKSRNLFAPVWERFAVPVFCLEQRRREDAKIRRDESAALERRLDQLRNQKGDGDGQSSTKQEITRDKIENFRERKSSIFCEKDI